MVAEISKMEILNCATTSMRLGKSAFLARKKSTFQHSHRIKG